jgi:2-polyprenyl-3-methyl-5-hydroxy-6-metoxy-1,4-benzoquinol methylase
MAKSLNQKLYQLNDTSKEFYSKDNGLNIGERWDKKAKNWDAQLLDKKNHLNRYREYDSFIIIAKKVLLKQKGEKITFLDVGCGTGIVSEELSPSFYKGTGIDISNKMILEAKKKNIPNMIFYRKSLFDLDKNLDGTFDFVVSRGILVSHYGIKYLYNIMAKLFSLTNNNGSVIFDFLNKDVKLTDVHLPQNKEYFSGKLIRDCSLQIGYSNVTIEGASDLRVLFAVLTK